MDKLTAAIIDIAIGVGSNLENFKITDEYKATHPNNFDVKPVIAEAIIDSANKVVNNAEDLDTAEGAIASLDRVFNSLKERGVITERPDPLAELLQAIQAGGLDDEDEDALTKALVPDASDVPAEVIPIDKQ